MPCAHRLLEALSCEISLILVDQAARYLRRSRRQTSKILQALLGEGPLEAVVVYTPPPLCLTAPLFAWEPGHPEPRCGALSRAARIRWIEPPAPMLAYFVTPRAAKLFGGVPITKTALIQAAHEVNMTSLYLQYVEAIPAPETEWIRGDIFAGRSLHHGRVPDAVVNCRCGCQSIKAIEFAGGYSSTRIRSFHRFCSAHEMPYEIW